MNKNKNSSKMASSYCSSEHCVRCNKYEATREKSLELLDIYTSTKDLFVIEQDVIADGGVVNANAIGRIRKAVEKAPDYDPKKKQNPNVVEINGLPTEPFWKNDKGETSFKDVQKILEQSYQTILSEFLALPAKTRWIENTTPHGTWRVFHLVNQGLLQKENCALVPETMKIIELLPGVMKHNVFGNVCFSVVDAGTWITPHYGPCNCRIRCHLGLITTPQYHLILDGIRRRSWRNGRCLFFDDSFLHEVRYLDDHVDRSNDSSDESQPNTPEKANSLGKIVAKRQKSQEEDYSKRLSRAILLVDLWHPDLTEAEIDALNYVFPSSETSYQEWKSEMGNLGDST